MNHLPAHVTAIEQHEGITVVAFDVLGTGMRMIALGLNLPIKEGSAVVLGVKATNVVIAVGPVGQNSISNRLRCTVATIARGTLLCNVTLHFEKVVLECTTTVEACNRLGLHTDMHVDALIKASELSILHVTEEPS